jgi:hypothetical protein
MTAAKTTEELQQDEKKNGILALYNEWSWWYPWYMLHVKINVGPIIDIGFNPLLPGGETIHFDSLGVFANTIEEVWQSIIVDLLGLLVSYVCAKWLSATAFWLPIEFMKNVLQGLALSAVWDLRDSVLAISLASFIMGSISVSVKVAEQFVEGLESLVWATPMSFIYKSMTDMITIVGGVSFFHTWVDDVEIVSDFAWGTFALAHYFGEV